jgi:hypothetical protein
LLSTDHLQQIEEHWGIAPADLSTIDKSMDAKEVLIANLYQRLQSRNAWETATRDLKGPERDLINFLAIHGGDLESGEVCRRFFERDNLRMFQMVNGLAARGLVFFDEVPGLPQKLTLIGIPEPFLRFIDLPAFWEGYLGHFLKELSNNELKHIATQGLKLAPASANKNYLIHLIRATLLDPAFLRKYIDRLAEAPGGVFQSLIDSKGVAIYRDLLELNIQRRYDQSRGDAIQWLLGTSGLVFTAVPGGNKYNNLLMIPRDLMYILSNHFQPDNRTFRELDSVSVVEKQKPPAVILDNSNTLLRDLVIIAQMVDRHPVRVLATGGIGKNDLKRLMPYLSANKSVKYAEFLTLFLIERKLLVSSGETYHVSRHLVDWLSDSQAAYQDILSWWLTSSAWNEEYVEGNTIHVEPQPTGLVSIVGFRRVVLDVLSEMPRDRWCVESGFYEQVLPKIQQDIPRRGEPMAYDKHTRGNELVMESVLAETLNWLGILAIGFSSDKDIELVGVRQGDGKTLKARGGSRGRPRKQKGLSFTFRFTDLGRFVFSRPLERWGQLFEKENDDEVLPLNFDVDAFILQPTHEAIVPPDLELESFYRLNQIGQVRSVDVMSIIAITRESVREGLDRGWSGEEILEFLKTHSRTPVPDSLSVMIKECGRKHGELNMGFAGGFIVVDDQTQLLQLQSNKKISPSIKRVVDDRIVLLHSDVDLKRLAREMQKIGFMPRLESQHVTVMDDETYSLSLPREDMVKVIAALRYAMEVRDDKGRQIAHDRLAPLVERLRADARSYQSINDLADPLVQTWTKAANAAVESKISRIASEYTAKISHLVTNSVPRGTSKFNFSGPNPAVETDDIREMIDFAIDNEFEVEIEYLKATRDLVTELIAPESLERDRLYAHCRTRDAYSVYRVERIQQARLV